MKKLFVAALMLLLAALMMSPAHGSTLRDYKVIRVVDGDTVEFEAPFLIPELGHSLKLRVLGVDTPEKGRAAKCNKEEQKSLQAKLFTEQQISNGKKVVVYIKSWDKYGGRVLGDVIIDGKPLSTMLLESKYAVPYNGKGAKNDWCQ
jgi:endonuclease YncB( thermonuclease family)